MGLQQLIARSGKTIIFPFYHTISDHKRLHVAHLYHTRSMAQFETELDFFCKYYQPIDIPDVLNIIETGRMPGKPCFHLSFDDGLRESYDYIAPLLKKKGIPATFFLNTAFLDNKNLFYRYKASLLIDRLHKAKADSSLFKQIGGALNLQHYSFSAITNKLLQITYPERGQLDMVAEYLGFSFNEYLQEQRPYLTSNEVSSLISRGFHIGSHSMDHPEYFRLSLEDQLFQTTTSMEYLESQFDLPYRLFSFPFTDYKVSNEFFERMFNSHKPILDLSFGTSGIKKDQVHKNLQRIAVEDVSFPASYFTLYQYICYFLKIPFGKHIIRRS